MAISVPDLTITTQVFENQSAPLTITDDMRLEWATIGIYNYLIGCSTIVRSQDESLYESIRTFVTEMRNFVTGNPSSNIRNFYLAVNYFSKNIDKDMGVEVDDFIELSKLCCYIVNNCISEDGVIDMDYLLGITKKYWLYNQDLEA